MGLACLAVHSPGVVCTLHLASIEGPLSAHAKMWSSLLTCRLQYGNRPWYRHVCAIGAVFNILMMMAANLVGFVIGTDGVSYMLQQLLGTVEGSVVRLCRRTKSLMFMTSRTTIPFLRVHMSLRRCPGDVRV